MVKCALEIDHENGNSLWQDAIALEMEAVHVAFKVMIRVKNHHPDTSVWSVTSCLIGFWHKAHLVARGDMNETPAVLTNVSVVSRDSVCIALTIATLNDLQVKASDVQNAFLRTNLDNAWS